MKLIYVANIRLPTEKAHGLQIMQNCEAFADQGVQVELWVARRQNTPELRQIEDVYTHYGVNRSFAVRWLPTLDLLPLAAGSDSALSRLLFALQLLTFTLAALLLGLVCGADIFYSRDRAVLLALALVKPRQKLVYEAHSAAHGRLGRWLQRQTVRRCAHVFATTAHLRDELIALGSDAACTHVAPDGFRAARFDSLPSLRAARSALGWPQDAFIIGYVGRLHTMGQDKGAALLVDALALVEGASLALVGGPDEVAADLRARWLANGRPADMFLYTGQVAAAQVPHLMAAFDVCALPLPWTQHFAYYASALKLFEYLAAGRAVVASDLPSTREIVTDGETALLFPPGDAARLAAVITRLRDDPDLRQQLAAQGRALASQSYTWAARAARILSVIES